MYTDPDPQFLAAARSLEIGQECPVFQRAELATLPEPENRKCARTRIKPYTVENL